MSRNGLLYRYLGPNNCRLCIIGNNNCILFGGVNVHGSNNFFCRKYGVKKQGDTFLRYGNHSGGAVRPTSKMKTKVTLYITPFHSTLGRFLRCAWASTHLYFPLLFLFFLGPRFWGDFWDGDFLTKFVFLVFSRISAEEHAITPPWSDYSSPVATQPSGDIGNSGIACGHSLEYCNLCHFFFKLAAEFFCHGCWDSWVLMKLVVIIFWKIWFYTADKKWAIFRKSRFQKLGILTVFSEKLDRCTSNMIPLMHGWIYYNWPRTHKKSYFLADVFSYWNFI